MIKIPRIVFFRPDEQDLPLFQALFQRHEYVQRQVNSAAEISHSINEEGENFDAVVIPLRLQGGASGVNSCIQVRSDEVLAPLPVLMLSPSKDKAILQGAYGVGADVVLVPPFDADLLYFQITALARQKRAFDEQVKSHYEDIGLRNSIIQAFNASREGMLLFDNTGELFFANEAATFLLGLNVPLQKEELHRIAPQFSDIAQQALQSAKSEGSTGYERQLTRVNGQTFLSAIRSVTLTNPSGSIVGVAIALSDQNEIEQLSHSLLQARRMQTLALVASAGALQLLQDKYPRIPVAPLAAVEALLQKQPPLAKLDATLTALLEVMDLALSPAVSVKITSSVDSDVALRSSDLFQLLGHLLVFSVEFAGPGGEVRVNANKESSTADTNAQVTIVFSADSRKTSPLLPNDSLSRVLKGDFSRTLLAERDHDTTSKMTYGLATAQNILDLYDSMVEYQQSGEARMRIRIKLPIPVSASGASSQASPPAAPEGGDPPAGI